MITKTYEWKKMGEGKALTRMIVVEGKPLRNSKKMWTAYLSFSNRPTK